MPPYNPQGQEPVVTAMKPRLDDTDPEGVYSGAQLRNAIQGEGFTPSHDEIFGDQPDKRSKLRQIR